MRADPDPDAYRATWTRAYRDLNYRSAAGFFMRRGHILLERGFDETFQFGKVLEVGTGPGTHFPYVRHRYGEYWMTDSSPEMLDLAKMTAHDQAARVHFSCEDACRLSFPDRSFDRLIAAHVLEHLPNPHEVLREWVRVLVPGGTLSLLLPCDPGLTWRLARCFGPRRSAIRRGIDYDYWMAREHINSIYNLRTLIRFYFSEVTESWWPTHLAVPDANAYYAANVTAADDA